MGANVRIAHEQFVHRGVEHHTYGYLKAAFCELIPKEQMARLAGA